MTMVKRRFSKRPRTRTSDYNLRDQKIDTSKIQMEEISLKNIAKLLREADDSEKPAEKEKGEDSLDSQVDKYLTQYEAQAKEESRSTVEAVSYYRLSRDWRSLTEAEEESTEDEEITSPEKLKLDEIDMRSFVSDVMRLVENHESLLETKNTILRRAANMLIKNYEPDAVASFKEELLDSYGIEIGQSQSDKEDEYQPPKAGAAGPMSGAAGATP